MEIWPVTAAQEKFAVVVLTLALIMVPAWHLPDPWGPWITLALGLVFAAAIIFDTWVRPQVWPELKFTDEQRFRMAYDAWMARQAEVDGDRIAAIETAHLKLREQHGNLMAQYETLKGTVAALQASKTGE